MRQSLQLSSSVREQRAARIVNMRVLRTPALVAAVIASILAPIAAAVYVRAHDGFGAGDIRAFAVWSVGLGLFVAASIQLVYRRAVRLSRISRATLGAAWGAVSGILFTYTLALGMGPSIGAFSFPILYLWVAAAAVGCAIGILFVTPEQAVAQIGRRLRWTVSLSILVLAFTAAAPRGLLLGAIYIWDRAAPEIHLLPSGFTGPVVILFEQSDGAPPLMDGPARVYQIPASGVLRTQFRDNPGWSSPKYYYRDASGRRTSIVAGAPCEDSLAADPVQACLEGTLYIGNRSAPPYSAYVVGRRRDREEASERVDSLVRAVVYGETKSPAP